MLIQNAKILTCSGIDYPHGADILVRDGKILQIGTGLEAAGEKIIDARGLTACPGFVDAHSHIGMFEDGLGVEGNDGNEAVNPLTPSLRAIDAINPQDRCFEEAREAGVTLSATGPGSANVISGQFAAVKHIGVRVEDMLVKEPLALKLAFGENPKRVYSGQKKSPTTRMATAALLRQALVEAENYRQKRLRDKDAELDIEKEILVKALEGKLIVKAHAHRADDIFTALRIAKEFQLKMTVEHATEGYLFPHELKQMGARLILGPLLLSRPKVELKNLSFRSTAVLDAAGVPFALMTDHPEIPVQYLPLCASIAIREGLSETSALHAITIRAAQMIGLEERVGSLESGKDADIALFDGHPLDVRARCKMTLIDGKVVHEG